MSLKFGKLPEMLFSNVKKTFLVVSRTTFRVVLVNFLRLYNENEDLVIFEKFHDPGPAKKFKKFGNILKKMFSRNNQKSLFWLFENNISGSFGEF